MTASKDLHLARALLVDGNAVLRGVTAMQLRAVGVGHVTTASRLRDARLLLERERFDIVVCNRDFDGTEMSGQDLLDELRRERILSPSTVFLMIVGSATYHHVVEAAEASLDAILVRPYTAVALGRRLTEARRRKRELGDVLQAMDAGETETALACALQRFSDRAQYWVYCGRLAAELLLLLKRPDDAAMLFEELAMPAASAAMGTAWARLGAARARFAAGDIGHARRAVQEFLEQESDNADAHDLLGRILVEQCEFDLALQRYQVAAQLTPGCLLRQQHTGALAFYQGQAELAITHLDRALSLGFKSSLFDALTLLLIAMLRYDQGDAQGVGAARDLLRTLRERYPASARIGRFVTSAEALHRALTDGASAGAAASAVALAKLAAQVQDDNFDLEAAAMLLALARRLADTFDSRVEYERVVQRIGRRFSVTKAIAEVLVAASGRSQPATTILQACHAEVTALAEQAMEQALQGSANVAVRTLLERGEATRNMRLIELSGALLRRHPGQIEDAEALSRHAATLAKRFGHAVNHIAGIQRSGRAPGAMHLRGVEPSRTAGEIAAAEVTPIPPSIPDGLAELQPLPA